MHIFIKGTTTLQQIATEFSNIYPFLKLQFFKSVMSPLPTLVKVEDYQQSLIDLDCIIPDSHLSIQFWQTTDIVERTLSAHTGLYVEIYRKFDDSWIRTDGSDDLTLEEQNHLGSISGTNQSNAYYQPPF